MDKILNDAIHGAIKLKQIYFDIIDTEQFQRLRNIHQLGSAYFVFPSATHTRFEHSIGVCHLAERLAKKLQDQLRTEQLMTKEGKPLEISDDEVKCVAIAGLCHDLGHGPFSHLWQTFLDEKNEKEENKEDWKHEKESCKNFRKICEQQDIDLTQEEINRICSFINPGDERKSDPETELSKLYKQKPFLWEIVNNKKTKIDVDKWDYFERDCHYLGKKNSFDHDRLMQFIRVVKDEKQNFVLAFRDKEAQSILHMFYMRWHYHHRYYKHPKIRIIDQMLMDGFKRANLDETKSSEDEFKIIKLVKKAGVQDNIYDRIQKRKLYKAIPGTNRIVYADHENVTDEIKEIEKRIKTKMEEYGECKDFKENIYLSTGVFDFGHKEKDPFANKKIRFYSKSKPNEVMSYDSLELPVMRLECFQEVRISCVSKIDLNGDQEVIIRRIYEDCIKSFCAKQEKKLISQHIC